MNKLTDQSQEYVHHLPVCDAICSCLEMLRMAGMSNTAARARIREKIIMSTRVFESEPREWDAM
jgi:hypothetical protein